MPIVALVTARKRSLGQDNVFTSVCHSVYGGGGEVSVQGGLSKAGVAVQGALCQAGISVQGGLCSEGFSLGLSVGGGRGGSVKKTPVW